MAFLGYHRYPRHAVRAQRGITLIEILVSTAIGVVLILAAMVTYLGTSSASRAAEAQMRMGEDAYAALTIISQNLKMAGNNPIQPNRLSTSPRNPVFDATNYFIRGCNHKFSDITTATGISTLTCSTSTTTDTHSISLIYEADQFNTMSVPVSGVPTPTDCLGQSLTPTSISSTVMNGSGTGTTTATITYYISENRYYIGTSTAVASPSLYCKGLGGAAQPLVENVEDLKFSYGTAAATGTATVVVGYLNAATLQTETNLAALASEALRWSRVIAVRVCVLMRSEQYVMDKASSAAYMDCDGNYIANPPDLRLRRAYSTTVVLRNRTNPNN